MEPSGFALDKPGGVKYGGFDLQNEHDVKLDR